jgi:hypothetical protein
MIRQIRASKPPATALIVPNRNIDFVNGATSKKNAMTTMATKVIIVPMPFSARAADHRRTAMSLFAGTLNAAAPFSIAAASSGASTVPSRTALAAIL